jgi:D-alanyl-D-alanine carboxypeptidase
MYGEKPHQRAPIASITKIATTIVALERGPSIDTQFTASISGSAMAARDGSQVIGMEPGERISFETLLYGMMLHSGNDAAEQTALSIGGSRERYLDWMNQEAASIGLRDTHFATPSGMDTPGHYSSAYDMAMLARYAMRNETFRTLAGTRRYAAEGYVFSNLNRLLGVYPGMDGVKIGYTDEAHKTYVASAVRDGHRVFITLLRSEDLVADGTAMFDWVWQNFAW